MNSSTPSGTIGDARRGGASSLTPEPVPSDNTATNDTLVSHADLFITTAAAEMAAPGALLTFTLQVGHASGVAGARDDDADDERAREHDVPVADAAGAIRLEHDRHRR